MRFFLEAQLLRAQHQRHHSSSEHQTRFSGVSIHNWFNVLTWSEARCHMRCGVTVCAQSILVCRMGRRTFVSLSKVLATNNVGIVILAVFDHRILLLTAVRPTPVWFSDFPLRLHSLMQPVMSYWVILWERRQQPASLVVVRSFSEVTAPSYRVLIHLAPSTMHTPLSTTV